MKINENTSKWGTRRPPPYLGRAAQRLIPPVEVTSWVCTSHHLALINNRNCGGQGCCNHRDTETITVLGRAVNCWFICCSLSSQSNCSAQRHLEMRDFCICVMHWLFPSNLPPAILLHCSIVLIAELPEIDWCRPIALEQGSKVVPIFCSCLTCA